MFKLPIKLQKITLTATLVGSLLTGHVAYAGEIRVISSRTARETVPVIAVWEGSGINISLIETGEVIHKAWLDDPSRITLDFDGQLGKGAMVVHLRRIKPIEFDQLPSTPATLITLITQTQQGQRKRYQFRITYGKGSPQYYGITIKPSTPSHQPMQVGSEYINHVRQGLSYAKRQGWISLEQGNIAVEARVRQFLAMLRGGMNLNEAAQRSAISIALVEKLAELGEVQALNLKEAGGESCEAEASVNRRCIPWLDLDCDIGTPQQTLNPLYTPADFSTEFMILPSFEANSGYYLEITD